MEIRARLRDWFGPLLSAMLKRSYLTTLSDLDFAITKKVWRWRCKMRLVRWQALRARKLRTQSSSCSQMMLMILLVLHSLSIVTRRNSLRLGAQKLTGKKGNREQELGPYRNKLESGHRPGGRSYSSTMRPESSAR